MQSIPLCFGFPRRLSSGSWMLFIIVWFGCQSKGHHSRWDNASIDPTIAGNTAFGQLDRETEVFSVFENQDVLARRSSGVLYFTKGHVNLSDSSSANLNNCRAHFLHGDTLTIKIGIGNGFGGWGFTINYKDKKFYTEPFYSTDVVIPDDPEPVFKVVYQRLALDKPVYKVGDSLYGKIEFKIVEIYQDRKKIDHSGNGYFRTKVREL